MVQETKGSHSGTTLCILRDRVWLIIRRVQLKSANGHCLTAAKQYRYLERFKCTEKHDFITHIHHYNNRIISMPSKGTHITTGTLSNVHVRSVLVGRENRVYNRIFKRGWNAMCLQDGLPYTGSDCLRQNVSRRKI